MNDSAFDPRHATGGQVTFQLLVLSKNNGPLTKRISLADNGKVQSDGSACKMSVGRGWVETHTVTSLAERISRLEPTEALALGSVRDGIPNEVRIETKWSEAHTRFTDGVRPIDLIARSQDYISYRPGLPAVALLDLDGKGMPPEVRARIHALGGYWEALTSILPELAPVGRVQRRSTTTGLSHGVTGQAFPGSDGQHIFVVVANGADIERFLRVFHQRAWLAGMGWAMVGAGGAFLKRSLIDTAVGLGERLVFEGEPVVVWPLVQDQAQRRPVATEGGALDTRAVCRDLSAVERSKLRSMEAEEKKRLAPETAKERAKFIETQAEQIVARTGIKITRARQIADRQCAGVLLPDIRLTFDDLGDVTVGDILADPERYDGATLADPLEGPTYGACKAKVMRRILDGSLWINSFAHGGMTYELKHDAASIEQVIAGKPAGEAADVLIDLAPRADINGSDEERLRNLAAVRSKVGRASIKASVRAAREAAAIQRGTEARARREAERTDQRPVLPCPSATGERTPVMQALNDVLGTVDSPEPPMRDIEGHMVQVVSRRLPNLHLLTSAGANAEEPPEERMPAAEMPLLSRLDECELTELIERHIEFQNTKGDPVTLPAPFIKHFIHRQSDTALPVCSALGTLPMVMPGAVLLAKRGLDRERGILFRIPEVLMASLPKSHEECDDAAILAATKRLCDEWLVDVSADLVGKAVLLAFGLSIIERTQLSDRPVFFVTAARRGGGKTTALVMILVAITGIRPAAAAWSSNEEERRKALMAYLMEALPAIIWDNIPRGTQIACPHIEKACTAEFLSDRKLGVSENIVASAATIQAFTGNNIGPKGDLASRSLTARLMVNQPDPENRSFAHDDPINWTKDHRHTILADLFTVLLGNPKLRIQYAPPTRFKDWMRLVGSALEHAARLYRDDAIGAGADPGSIPVVDFAELFLTQDDSDEQSSDLSSALLALLNLCPKAFTAADLANKLNDQSISDQTNEKLADVALLREFLYPDRVNFPNDVHTSFSLGKRLKHHLGEPVPDPQSDGYLTLREIPTIRTRHKGAAKYQVYETSLPTAKMPGR